MAIAEPTPGPTPPPATAKSRAIRVLGIDPGTRIAGYGIVDVGPCGRLRGVAAGAWVLPHKEALAVRLSALQQEVVRVVASFAPTHLSLELAFVGPNVRSALALGHARGVVLATAHQHGLCIFEVSATAAKKAVAHGHATKEQVARYLAHLLGVPLEKLPLDATDALAIAYALAEKTRREGRFAVVGG